MSRRPCRCGLNGLEKLTLLLLVAGVVILLLLAAGCAQNTTPPEKSGFHDLAMTTHLFRVRQ